MKIFSVTGPDSGQINIEVGVDSAMLRPGEPVFLTEPFADWTTAIVPAVRICRLGTNIHRHPENYYDAVTVMHVLRPSSPAVCPGLPPLALDRALSPGKWIDKTARDYELTVRRVPLFEFPPSPHEISQRFFTLESLKVNQAISLISKHITFRTGDILLFPDYGISQGPPEPDTRAEAWLNGDSVLNIRLK